MKLKLIISFIFGLTTFVIVVFFISLNKNNTYDTKNLIGQNISDFSLYGLTDNILINKESLKNNEFTLINFWASWCAPCRIEHPILLSLNNEHRLKILGVNFKDKKKNASKFLEKLGNPYYLTASDEEGKTTVVFGIYGIPESILVDSNLKVIAKFIGPLTEDDYKNIKEIIK
jgi:cytochrome c biogenesis protein CcmG/thiol:disulfide interchange protein DsbE